MTEENRLLFLQELQELCSKYGVSIQPAYTRMNFLRIHPIDPTTEYVKVSDYTCLSFTCIRKTKS